MHKSLQMEVITIKCGWGKIGLLVGGVLLGTAGLKILSSRAAKRVYTYTTAALRAKDDVRTTVTTIREHAGDILADAKELNEQRTETLEPVPNHTGKQAHTRSPLHCTGINRRMPSNRCRKALFRQRFFNFVFLTAKAVKY